MENENTEQTGVHLNGTQPELPEMPSEAQSSPLEWTVVAQVDELKDGGSKAVTVGTNDVALFRKGEEFFAVANECSHYGAPLCGGYVSGSTVMCPWHGWQFDLNTGECLSVPGCDIEAFKVKVEDGAVSVAAA